MIHRIQSRYVLLILLGLLLLLSSIVEIIADTHADTIAVASFGIYLVVTNGYAYLRPDTTASTKALLGAIGGFMLFFVVAMLVYRRYSKASFFSTSASTFDVFYTVMWLGISVWLVFYYFSLRSKEQK
jgi:hypothetical protein